MTIDALKTMIADAARGISLDEAGRGTTPDRAATIKMLAQQFESTLIAQMLRDMQNETFQGNEGTAFGGPLADEMYGQLAGALTGTGGLGLAKSLESSMARTLPGATEADAIESGKPFVRPYAPWQPDIAMPLALSTERITSAYGARRDPISGDVRMHKGIDIPLALGDDVRSMQAGVVIESGTLNGYGNTVVVDHGDGLTTRYAHLSARDVAVGDRVEAGQLLGLAGRTGRATGPHLHLEVRKDGVAIDPTSPESLRLLGKVVAGTARNAISADDTHGASR